MLIVDDGAADRELLATVLRYGGHQIVEADSGEHALSRARSRRPDLIIADILMPTMDGYELVRELRGDRSTEEIPVIFYTATWLIDEVRTLAAALGVTQILLKPSEPDDVLRVVSETLAEVPDRVPPIPSEDFHREHLRLLNAKLLQKVEELRETVILAGALQRETDAGTERAPEDARSTPAPDLRTAGLSPRELEVLRMIVDGYTNGEIAERLVIATSTVQSHVKRILRKLGVKNRTEAAVRYVRR